MTAFVDLTPEQQARANEYTLLMRPIAGDLAKLLNRMVAAQELWTNDVQAICTALTNGSDIPNPSGLAEAAAMTDLDYVTMQGYFDSILTSFNDATRRANYVQAAGAVNTV